MNLPEHSNNLVSRSRIVFILIEPTFKHLITINAASTAITCLFSYVTTFINLFHTWYMGTFGREEVHYELIQ